MGKVLVTGANGFVAMHIVLQLLSHGHIVVGTVRSVEKGHQAGEHIPAGVKDKMSWSVVEDAGAEGAFDKVIKENEFDGVIHTATPFHYNIKDPHELFDPAVLGTTNILHAIQSYGPSITRVVVLSSCAAVFDGSKGLAPGYTYTEADWNPITKETSLSGPPGYAYYGAKKFAEKAAWDFVSPCHSPKANFTINTICPPFIWGPVVNHVKSIKDLGTSNSGLYAFVEGGMKGGEIPPNGVWAWVDVRDVAAAHVAAYEKKDVANERFIITSGRYNNKQLCDAFRTIWPERASNLPTKPAPGYTNEGWPEGGVFDISNAKSVKLLGLEYRGLESMVRDFVESVKGLEGEGL